MAADPLSPSWLLTNETSAWDQIAATHFSTVASSDGGPIWLNADVRMPRLGSLLLTAYTVVATSRLRDNQFAPRNFTTWCLRPGCHPALWEVVDRQVNWHSDNNSCPAQISVGPITCSAVALAFEGGRLHLSDIKLWGNYASDRSVIATLSLQLSSFSPCCVPCMLQNPLTVLCAVHAADA